MAKLSFVDGSIFSIPLRMLVEITTDRSFLYIPLTIIYI
jgi:hypothetical protein